MALGELYVEVGDQGLHVIVALDLQVEGGGEGDVLLCAGLDVDLLDQAGVGDHLDICMNDREPVEGEALTWLQSTVSTRGSVRATLRMQDMSKPYTSSHLKEQTFTDALS